MLRSGAVVTVGNVPQLRLGPSFRASYGTEFVCSSATFRTPINLFIMYGVLGQHPLVGHDISHGYGCQPSTLL